MRCVSPSFSAQAANGYRRWLSCRVTGSRTERVSGAAMIETQRLAAAVIGGVLAGRSLDAELAAAWKRHAQLGAHDRAVVQDIAYGTLRFLGRLDALLDALLEKPLKDARLRTLLLVALYQLEHARAAPHAIVDHA